MWPPLKAKRPLMTDLFLKTAWILNILACSGPVLALFMSLRYRYVSSPSSCLLGTDMCPRPLHVSQVQICVLALFMSLRYRYVSSPSSCLLGTDMCPRPLHVSQVQICMSSPSSCLLRTHSYMWPRPLHVSQVQICVLALFLSLRYRYVPLPSSCLSGTYTCPSHLHVSQVQICVLALFKSLRYRYVSSPSLCNVVHNMYMRPRYTSIVLYMFHMC